MFKTVISLIITTLLIILSGCDYNPLKQNKNNILVLDLNAVAKAINRDTLINQQINQAEARLQEQLSKLQAEIENNLKVESEKSKSVNGKKETTKDLEIKAAQKMQLAVNEARQKVKSYRLELLNLFKGEVQPIAVGIAEKRKASIVRYTDTSILWFSDAVDITDEVIAELRSIQKK